jgi:indoleamine 2,3-dioxygenase
MPDTPLTTILQDFRSYRPGNHREFLEYVKARSAHLSLKSYALQEPSSAALYLLILNQVRDFRWRHWCFTREYILKKTTHPTATGGSPIVTWLPNQLQAVMQAMVDVWEGSGKRLGKSCEEVMDLLYVQRETLRKEVEKYCQERNVDTSKA